MWQPLPDMAKRGKKQQQQQQHLFQGSPGAHGSAQGVSLVSSSSSSSCYVAAQGPTAVLKVCAGAGSNNKRLLYLAHVLARLCFQAPLRPHSTSSCSP
jgi:hypothetical protein